MGTSDHSTPKPPYAWVVAVCLLGGLLAAIVLPSLFYASDAWQQTKQTGVLAKHPILQAWVHPILQTCLTAPFALFAWWLSVKCHNTPPHKTSSQDQPSPWRLGLCVRWQRAALALAVGTLSTCPMFVLGLFSPQQNQLVDWVNAAILPGMWEEILYRGVVFGGLVQLARWRIWPAALVTGLVFGLAHLVVASVRGMPLGQQIPWLALIGLGGVLYAWLHARWGFNLWLPIALHVFMNGWWTVFDLPNNALAPWAVTASRILTIGLAITATEVLLKRNVCLIQRQP